MNDIEKYKQQLAHELRDLNESERDDILAEIQTHIEDGLADEQFQKATAVNFSRMLQELGSPATLAQNLRYANWKQNLRNALLALLPLLLLNSLTYLIHTYLDLTPATVALPYILNFLICLGLILLAQRLRSKLLVGWWLAQTMAVTFSLFSFSLSSWVVNWPPGEASVFWKIIPVLLVVLFGGLYGRFLWQHRSDGLVITPSLIPFMWAMIYFMSVSALMIETDYLMRTIWTTYFSVVALTAVALSAFMLPNRLHRWLVLFVVTSFYAVSAFVVWLPDPNAVFWLFLFLPFILGFGLELTTAYTTKLRLTSR